MDFTIATARKRAAMMVRIREFFSHRSVLEVETPILSHSTLTDCYIDQFSTLYRLASQEDRVFLQTSPELHMKRLLADGFPDIFQIGKVFRNGELGRLHNPEFTMLEWYRRGFDMHQLIDEVTLLLLELFGEISVRLVTYQELFSRYTGIDPLKTTVTMLGSFLEGKGVTVPAFIDLSDALMYTMAMCIEPELPKDELVFVVNYPREQAVLSIIDPKDSRVARRFECYFKGMELANGFEELTDPKEYGRRTQEENQRRQQRGKPIYIPDSDFKTMHFTDIPDCSGVAIGLDRVLLCCTNLSTIDEVISFGWNSC